jgi:hypothetical protein
MSVNINNAIRDLLNEGYSIFGELGDHIRRIDDLKDEIRENAITETDQTYVLNAFEVHKETKNHKSPYVTMSLNGELISGYATVLGNKLMKIAKHFGEIENDHHFYMRNTGDIKIKLSVNESPNGEYIDIIAV